MTLGLYLLSRLGVDTSFWLVSLYLFILGVGIGASLQVLIIAVQNAVDYTDLGAATSGVTFFRSIGGSFGTSVFGAIFSGVLAGDIAAALHGVPLPSGLSPSAGASPAVLQHLPAVIRDGYIAGYAQALHTVFLFATPLAALGFVLSLFLKEVPLRDTVRAVDRAQSTAPTAIPAARDSAQEMERALMTLFGRERRAETYRRLAEAAGVPLSPRGTWLMYRVADSAPIPAQALAGRLGIAVAELDQRLTELLTAGTSPSRPPATSPSPPPAMSPGGQPRRRRRHQPGRRGRHPGGIRPRACGTADGRPAGRRPAERRPGSGNRPPGHGLGAGPRSGAAQTARADHPDPGRHRRRARA